MFKYTIILFTYLFMLFYVNCKADKKNNIYKIDKPLENIVNAIIDNKPKELILHFYHTVTCYENNYSYGNFTISNNYSNFDKKRGALYIFIYDTKKLRKQRKNNLLYCIRDVLLNSNEVESIINERFGIIPQISAYYNKKNYNIFLKKIDNSEYKITGFKISD